MTGLLIPKNVGIRPFFSMILVVYLGHGIFHPVVALLFFSKSVFGRGLNVLTHFQPHFFSYF